MYSKLIYIFSSSSPNTFIQLPFSLFWSILLASYLLYLCPHSPTSYFAHSSQSFICLLKSTQDFLLHLELNPKFLVWPLLFFSLLTPLCSRYTTYFCSVVQTKLILTEVFYPWFQVVNFLSFLTLRMPTSQRISLTHRLKWSPLSLITSSYLFFTPNLLFYFSYFKYVHIPIFIYSLLLKYDP